MREYINPSERNTSGAVGVHPQKGYWQKRNNRPNDTWIKPCWVASWVEVPTEPAQTRKLTCEEYGVKCEAYDMACHYRDLKQIQVYGFMTTEEVETNMKNLFDNYKIKQTGEQNEKRELW